ncbi:MAG: hypothetical protein H0X30_33340 [Anaerolineae bacterium]|nr:hypothetical protein [Anaerolineae bacterium]
MDTPTHPLSSEQMTLLFENHELLDALLALTDSEGFKLVFSEMSLDEVMSRYESTLHFDDSESDTVLRERYLRMKAEESSTGSDVLLKKLRAKSLFDESDDE